jgi:hypothetical protein
VRPCAEFLLWHARREAPPYLQAKNGDVAKTLTELAEKLSSCGVSEDAYSLSGGLPNEAYCIENADDKWHVYYSERGIRTGQMSFDSEQDACDYLFQLVTG